MPNQHARKWEGLLSFTAVGLALLLLNIQAANHFFRIDLTEEGRFTMTEATQQTLSQLDDVVQVDVFLAGDLNASFKRLQQVIRETLEEFKQHAGPRLEYRFIDPYDAPNPQAQAKLQQQLVERGVPSTYLNEMADGQRIQKMLFPGAIVSYKGQERPVLLLKGNKGASPEEQINQSAEGAEYELISAIAQLSAKDRARIGILQGRQALDRKQLLDAWTSLEEAYSVAPAQPTQASLAQFDALIVPQPKEKFSEDEVFALDQYIVGGGKVLFFLDKIQMNIDSIATGGTYAFGYDLGIEDLLFRLGVKINNDLIQDQQAGLIEVYTGQFGNQPQVQRLPWPYYAYLNTFGKHPIVRNLDAIYGKFVSTIDTVYAEGVAKTPLVFTSAYTKVRQMPAMVDLNELKGEMRVAESYNKQNLPVCYLLEGEFSSLYANLPSYKGAKPLKKGQSKVIVFADGDIIRSEINPKTQKAEPIDFDRVRGQTLSNKDFLENALAYLLNEEGLINARKKQVALRLLDGVRVKEERAWWQAVNIALPVASIVLFGLGYAYWRRRRYM